MGYEMAQGRFFERDFKSDTAAIILNEAAWKQMGYTNVTSMDGGIKAWREAGYPMES